VSVFDPTRHCGAPGRRGGGPCRNRKGFKTPTPGAGRCFLHGGATPNGQKHAQRELAEAAVAKLGVPRGTGDPFALLSKAVQHSQGLLEASGHVVATIGEPVKDGEKRPAISVDVAVELYAEAIRTASRTGKAAVDADVADRMAALDERAGDLLMRFVRELLERVVPVAKRPEIEAWASMRLGELAAEYEQPAAVH
jgi:hypothetical protein